jgi:hypothetical protein
MRNEAARYRSEHSDFGRTGLDALSSLWQAAIIALDLLAILASVRLPRVRYVTGCIAMVAMLGSFAINELTRYVAEMITINI